MVELLSDVCDLEVLHEPAHILRTRKLGWEVENYCFQIIYEVYIAGTLWRVHITAAHPPLIPINTLD